MRAVQQILGRNKTVVTYFCFVVLFELLHILINSPPPISLRLLYIAFYLLICFIDPRHIPVFMSVNIILERSSLVFGEFLPNTALFHIIILLGCLISLSSQRRTRLYSQYTYIILCLLFFYVLVISFFHRNFSDLYNLTLLLIYINVLCYLNKDEISLLLRYILLSSLVSIAFVFFNIDTVLTDYSLSGVGVDSISRASWKDSNYISTFIASILLVSTIFHHNTSNKVYKKFCILVFTTSLILLTFLISRGAILAVCISLCYYFRKDILKKKGLFSLLLFLLFLYVLYIFGLLDGVIYRFMSNDVKTGSGRFDLWQIGLTTFFSNDFATILLGGGPHSADGFINYYGCTWSPHNNFIQILFDYGFIGLTLVLFLFFSLWFRRSSEDRHALLLFLFINSMTVVPLIYVFQLWVLLPYLFISPKSFRYSNI